MFYPSFLQRKNSIVQKRKGRGEAGGNGTLSGWSNNERHEYRCIAKTSDGASLRSAPTNILYAGNLPTNNHDSIFFSKKMILHVNFSCLELAHAFNESPKDLTVREGEVSRLSCSIDSVPYPSNITWLHDGEIVPTEHLITK